MKVCLSMICKNEAHVLRRALDSARPFVDEYCIVDTGSTDGTQEIIKEYGPLHERPWRDFGTNRQEALRLAEETTCDFTLFLDADDVLEATHLPFSYPDLSLPGYTLPVSYGDTSYTRCALIKNNVGWRWEGALHEYLTSDVPLQQGSLTSPVIKIIGGGARSKDPETYKKDVAILEAALRDDPTNARYAFYLAQSYKDAGQPEQALEAYRRRARMPGWIEETWFAQYQIAVLEEWAGYDQAPQSFLTAYQLRPSRAEPLYHLARHHRLKNEHALGYMYASTGNTIPYPSDALFVDRSIYDWRIQEEVALSAYYVGRKDEGRAMLLRLIAEAKAPAENLVQFNENLRWYV